MNPRQRAAMKRQRALLEAWQARGIPVGASVAVGRDDGSVLFTVTRSEPWLMGEYAVVQVKGITGCYSLERVALVEDLQR